MGSSDIEMSGQRSAQDFAGRVVIVTGAWRGLGRAAAERFHERGAAVAVNVRDSARAESLAASIGEHTLAVPGDIAAPGVAEEIVRMTLERFGRIDVIVNNAALARATRFPDLTAEEWRAAGVDDLDSHYDAVERRSDVDTDESARNGANAA